MSFRAPMPSFAGGEVSKKVAARFDVAKYQTALARGRNVLGLPEGGFYIRPGLEFCDRTIDYTKNTIVIPFVFAIDQSYALEFSEGTMRVFSGGSPVIRPKITITNITRAAQAVVTVPDHDYVVGWRVQFSEVQGMVEINGLIGKILSIAGNDVTVDIDSSGFSAFTGDAGGIAGNANGGLGGYPGTPPTEPPGVDDDPTPPPTTPPGGGAENPNNEQQ